MDSKDKLINKLLTRIANLELEKAMAEVIVDDLLEKAKEYQETQEVVNDNTEQTENN